jgi:DNA-binding Lrp family transcriptional regulator
VTAGLDVLDRRLLDRAQAGVPLAERPFAALGAELGLDERDTLARLARLETARVLRQIGGIFDTRACGYASALVAARLAPARVEAAASVVAAHPGVSHCYERDHAWNLWFTLAVPPASALGLAGTIERLGRQAGAGAIRELPALRVFKIAARFDLDGDGGAGASVPPAGAAAGERAARTGAAVPAHTNGGPAPLTAAEIAAVRALQRPLALVAEPFAQPARDAGLTAAELLDHARALGERGVMRRFAALLDHRRAGFGANVMAAWALPAGRVEAAGTRVAALQAITHCYERPTFPDWPYALFSMIHGRNRDDCVATVEAIRAAIQPQDAALLWTVREFKKTRLQLFTPDDAAWEAGR